MSKSCAVWVSIFLASILGLGLQCVAAADTVVVTADRMIDVIGGRVVGVAMAKKTLEGGFTTIRNVGSANYDDVAIKQAIEAGYVPGPRIVPATYAIGATGGHCDSTEFPPSLVVPSPQIADGPDAIRAMVCKLHKYGAEVIKFCGTGGMMSKGDSVGSHRIEG